MFEGTMVMLEKQQKEVEERGGFAETKDLLLGLWQLLFLTTTTTTTTTTILFCSKSSSTMETQDQKEFRA